MGEKRSEVSRSLPPEAGNALIGSEKAANQKGSKTFFQTLKKEKSLQSEVAQLKKLNNA